MDNFEQLSKEQLVALQRAVLAINDAFQTVDDTIAAVRQETAVLFDAAEVHLQLFDRYSYKEPLGSTEQPSLSASLVHGGKQIGVVSVVRERPFAEDEQLMLTHWGELAGAAVQVFLIRGSADSTINGLRFDLQGKIVGVQGYSELLLRVVKNKVDWPANWTPEKLSMEMVSWLEHINKSASQMSTIVRDALNMFRLENGTMHFHIDSFVLKPIVVRAIERCQEREVCQQVEVRADVAPEIQVTADELRLQDLLEKLLESICVNVEKPAVVKIDAIAKEQLAKVRIKFNIDIIPDEEAAVIFVKPYPLGDLVFNRRGLDLYIAKLLVEGMEGEIGFEQGEGGESMFWFTLPLE